MLALQNDRHLTARYEVIRLLGTGGMARVFEVLDHHTGKRVALKTPLAGAGNLDARQLAVLFKREVVALQRLDGPGVLQLLDSGRLPGGIPFIVTELLRGETLAARIDRAGPMRVDELERMAASALAAMQEVHSAGFVHRDVNPDNIFLSQNRGVVLIDFGLAVPVAPLNDELLTRQLGLGLIGTPAYLSPERVSGAQANEKSDMYALAAALVFAATGRPMMPQDTAVALFKAIAEGKRPGLRALCTHAGHALGPVLDRMLAREPHDRPSASKAAALLDAARAQSATTRAVDVSTHWFWWLAVAAALMLIGVGTGATLSTALSQPRVASTATERLPEAVFTPLPSPAPLPLPPAELPP